MEGIYLLYKLLLDNKPDIFVRLNKRWLITPEEREYYIKIKKFLSKYGVLPKPDTSPVGFTNEPLDYYIDVVKSRYLVSLVERLRIQEVTTDNVETVIRKFTTELNNAELTTIDGVIPEAKFNSFIIDTINDARIKRVSGFYGFSTGYPTLDYITGGITKGDIFVLCARLKKGKTIYMLNILRKLAKEVSCMFVSMEMSLYAITRRLVFLETKIPQVISPNRIVSSFHDEDFKKLNLKVTLVNGTVLKDVVDIISYITFYKPEIVFIDGAYLLPTEKIFKSEWEKSKFIVEELRRIALLTETPIVCSYQLNRQAVKTKEPRAEHIAFTDAIAQSASVVIAIHDAEIPTERRLFILANREGESDISIRVAFDWTTANFDELSDTAVVTYIEDLGIDDYLEVYSAERTYREDN